MPGNISAASPSGVFPQTLSTAFSEGRNYPVLANQYHDGTPQQSLITDGVNAAESFRTWKLSKRLTSADLATLKTFFEAHSGSLIPFYFYCPFENAPSTHIGSNYDSTGVSTTGRHVCRFTSQAWTETVGIARTDASLEFMEVA